MNLPIRSYDRGFQRRARSLRVGDIFKNEWDNIWYIVGAIGQQRVRPHNRIDLIICGVRVDGKTVSFPTRRDGIVCFLSRPKYPTIPSLAYLVRSLNTAQRLSLARYGTVDMADSHDILEDIGVRRACER